MVISHSEILKIAEQAIDAIGEKLDTSFTESEECALAVKLQIWIAEQRGASVIVEDEE